jgi:hypothetical protein
MRNFAYRDCRMHMGIPVCKRAGIAKKFAYGDPHTHNEVVRIRGLTYMFSPGMRGCDVALICSFVPAMMPQHYKFLMTIRPLTPTKKKHLLAREVIPLTA